MRNIGLLPSSSQSSHFIIPENTKKPFVLEIFRFLMFSGGTKQ